MQKLPAGSRTLTATSLARLGAYLDAADTCRIQVSPAQYRIAAKAAVRILGECEADALVIEHCSVSPALRELRSGLALAKGLSTGALVLPAVVWAAISASRPPQERT